MEKQPVLSRVSQEIQQQYNPLSRWAQSLLETVKEIVGYDEFPRSGNPDDLLRDSTIRQLVKEGRTPIFSGRIGQWNDHELLEWKYFYQVLPSGFNRHEVVEKFVSHGVNFFKLKDGTTKSCSTFSLNEKQAELLNEKIVLLEAELIR